MEKITDRKQRTDYARVLHKEWSQTGPAVAREWFASVPGLLEYTRAEILSR